MNRKLIYLALLFLIPASYGASNIYRHKEPEKELEFQNVYRRIDEIRVTSTTLPSGSTQYIQNTSSPQSATFNVSSGTSSEFYASTITTRNALFASTSSATAAVFSVTNSSITVGASGAPAHVFAPTVAATAGFTGYSTASIRTTVTNFPTTTQWGEIGQLILAAGRWDIHGQYISNQNGANITVYSIGISTTAGNSEADMSFGYQKFERAVPAQVSDTLNVYLSTVTSISQTWYLKVRANYTVATPQARGSMTAVQK